MLPVLTALVFAFRTVGLSYQELVILLLGHRVEGHPAVRRFALTLLISYQRALIVASHHTRSLTLAMVLKLGTATAVLFLCILWLDFVGATAAALALVTGRLASTVFLVRPARKTLDRLRDS